MPKRSSQIHFYYYLFAFLAFILSALVYCYFNNYFTKLVLVHIPEYGSVQGFATTSRDGRTFYQFNAIPYAEKPTRFQPPVPVKPWNGVRDATQMTPILCPQYDLLFSMFRGQEDCLVLSISTPASPKKKHLPMPVLVFLHGGLFMFGGNGEFYGGRYIMDEDVVLVTINYRVGILGSLNTGDEVATGNQGLKDQLLGLKFIKKIIRHFNGDPERVTLFGESAGGSSVHFHMLSPQSKGYFQRAISQSGSALVPWGFSRTPRKQALRLGNQVGCPFEDSQELVNCLRSLDLWDLIKPQERLGDVFIDPLDVYGPSVENVTSPDAKSEAFLTEYPYKLAAEGKTHAVPYMAGINSHEGCFRSSWFVGQQKLLNRLSWEWENLASSAFFLHKNDSETLHKVRKYHFGESDRDITESDYQALTNLVGDRLFTIPARDAAVLHAKHTGAPTYLYYFTERADQSYGDFMHSFSENKWMPRLLEIGLEMLKKLLYKRLNMEIFDLGSCHAEEIYFLHTFSYTSAFDITPNHPHYNFSKELVKTWVRFARYGEPGNFNGVTWEKLRFESKTDNTSIANGVTPKYLLLSSEQSKMIMEPFHSRLSFWQDLKLPRNLSPDQESTYNYDVMK